MNFLQILQNRHSVRNYTGDSISEEQLTTILQAGLLSPSSRAIRPYELIVVRDKATLQKLADCRVGSASMLANADVAVVVIANEELSDVWIEDCAIVMSNMHLMADCLGLGSCWIQRRLRQAPDGTTTEQYLREHLEFPKECKLEAILSVGMPAGHAAKTELSELPMKKVHYEKY